MDHNKFLQFNDFQNKKFAKKLLNVFLKIFPVLLLMITYYDLFKELKK